MGISLCTFLPWHKWAKRERLTGSSDKLTCSCGREYGINYDVGAILPWNEVRSLYDDLARLSASSPQETAK